MRDIAEILLLATLSAALLVTAKDVPSTAVFSCRGRSAGYYADLETGCQNYYMCDATGRRYTYSCPNQTLFQQRVMICDHWFMVDCSLSETHFGANLLIGQKNRHFIEHIQDESGHKQDRARSYPTRTREYYADPSTVIADDRANNTREDAKLLSLSANEIKQALSAKTPSSQSVTKKLFDDKELVVKASETSRYSYQFSPSPSGPIKTTSERSRARELTNNPFFRSLTVGSSPATLPNTDKGERDLLTFPNPQQGKDHVKSSGQNVFLTVRDENTRGAASTLGTSRTPATPSSPETFSTHSNREITSKVRSTPSFPNHQQRRTSTLVTTAVPLTHDYNLVTSHGHSNRPHITTPPSQKKLSSAAVDVEDFTSEPSLTTRYEFLKTRERANAPSQDISLRTPHNLGVTASPLTNQRLSPNNTQGRADRPAVQRGTTSYGEVQKTPGGFRFKSSDPPLTSETTSYGEVQKTPGGFRFKASDSPLTSGTTSYGEVQKAPGGFRFKASDPPLISDTTSYGEVQKTQGGFKFKTSDPPLTSGTTSDGEVQKAPGGFRFKASNPPLISDGGWGFTSVGVLSSVGGGIVRDSDETKENRGIIFTAPNKGLDSTRIQPIIESIKFGSPGLKQVLDSSLIPDIAGLPARDSKYSRVDDELDLSVVQQAALEEDDVNFNTVEVRVVDPRRMFFIPDSAAREAEMLSSNNETVLTISLPPSRHDGAMKFKDARRSEGRRDDCPQCHPAFLLPGQCRPCVQIRR